MALSLANQFDDAFGETMFESTEAGTQQHCAQSRAPAMAPPLTHQGPLYLAHAAPGAVPSLQGGLTRCLSRCTTGGSHLRPSLESPCVFQGSAGACWQSAW